MKRLIFLKLADANPDNKKLKAAELAKLEEKVLVSAYKSFRNGIKENKDVKIIEEISNLPQIVIEFSETQYHSVHDLLRSIEVVEIIDPNLPLTEAQLKAKDKAKTKLEASQSDADDIKKLKDKMAKYRK